MPSECEYVANLREKMTTIFDLVRSQLQATMERQKRDNDTRISMRNYSVGDMVYCLDSTRKVGKSPKLKSSVWKGPCLITRKISDLLFELKTGPNSRLKVIHHDRIKPYVAEETPSWIIKVRDGLRLSGCLPGNKHPELGERGSMVAKENKEVSVQTSNGIADTCQMGSQSTPKQSHREESNSCEVGGTGPYSSYDKNSGNVNNPIQDIHCGIPENKSPSDLRRSERRRKPPDRYRAPLH